MDTTPFIGLHYTNDTVMNSNLDRIDAVFGELGVTPRAERERLAREAEQQPADPNAPPAEVPPPAPAYQPADPHAI